MSKRDAEIYRRAAEIVSSDGMLGSCEAIAQLHDDGLYAAEVIAYKTLFCPFETPDQNPMYWGQLWGRNAQRCRILALLLMAAIVESEK